jgi:CRP/FNR family cyclic AMP-dependent transcriptional regulator
VLQAQAEVLISNGQEERLINILEEGDYLGEMALLSNQPRTATVRAKEVTELYILDQADFKSLLEQEPELRQKLMKTVIDRRTAMLTVLSG